MKLQTTVDGKPVTLNMTYVPADPSVGYRWDGWEADIELSDADHKRISKEAEEQAQYNQIDGDL